MSTEEHRFTIISYKIRTEKGRISDGIRCISPVPEQFIRKRIPVPEVVERKPELPAGAFRFQFGAAAAVRPEHIDPIIAGQPHRQPDDRAVMSRLYSLRDGRLAGAGIEALKLPHLDLASLLPEELKRVGDDGENRRGEEIAPLLPVDSGNVDAVIALLVQSSLGTFRPLLRPEVPAADNARTIR